MTASPGKPTDSLEELPPAMALQTLLLTLLAVVGGALAAALALPAWLPGLSASLLGPEPKVYWYLSRASGLVAYTLLWLSMAAGVIISNKLARLWPGGPTAFDLHQHASLLGLAFGLFHGLILIGDRYANYSLAQLAIPFAAASYRPAWVGLGQLGFYLLAVVSLSFYVRKRLGSHAWRLIHYTSYAAYLLALVHGVMAGSETGTTWAQALYWTTGGSLLFLGLYRVLAARLLSAPAASRRPAPPTADQ